LVAELLKCSERYLLEGVYPRILIEGIKLESTLAIAEAEKLKIQINNN
jgi:chaperonin GroEL (HSP60 family)